MENTGGEHRVGLAVDHTLGHVLERTDAAGCAVDQHALPRRDAAAVAQLGVVLYAEGQAVDAEQALPIYLRDQVAWAKS